MEETKKIRVKTTSKIYNLAFESIFKDQLEEKIKADNTHRSYKSWIDTILHNSNYESANGSSRTENVADESGELEEFLSTLASKLPECVETIEGMSAGKILFYDDIHNKIDVIYDESGLLGMNCKTVLTFDRKNPDRIVMYRTEGSGTSFVFDSKTPRIMCMYETEAGSMGIGIITHRIVNTVPQLISGKKHAAIIIDYALEMLGAKSEYNHFKMDITDVTK